MSDLRPKGVPVTIDGEKHTFLFTLSAIDALQSEFKEIVRDGETVEDPNILEIFISVFDKNAEMKGHRDLCRIVAVLLNDEAERKRRHGDKDCKTVTADDVMYMIDLESVSTITRAIMEAYGLSMPEPDEDEDKDPNAKSGQSS